MPKTAPGAILKNDAFRTFGFGRFFRPFVKPFLFGSNLGQAGERGGFEAIRGVINLGQFQTVTKEIRRFRNFYAAKMADFVVGVPGFYPEASWTRIRSEMKIQVYCVH